MSDTGDPFAALFDAQRRAIEQNRTAMHRAVELSKRAGEVSLGGVESAKSVQRSGNGLVRAATLSSLDSMSDSMPGGARATRDARDLLSAQFDGTDDVTDQTWDAVHDVLEQDVRALETFADQYVEAVDWSTDLALEALSWTEESASTWRRE